MKPLYSRRHRDLKIVSVIEMCLLHRGTKISSFYFKKLLQSVRV